jgi:hypothetical protein
MHDSQWNCHMSPSLVAIQAKSKSWFDAGPIRSFAFKLYWSKEKKGDVVPLSGTKGATLTKKKPRYIHEVSSEKAGKRPQLKW